MYYIIGACLLFKNQIHFTLEFTLEGSDLWVGLINNNINNISEEGKMRNHLNWLFLLIFGIALVGCQDDLNVNSPVKDQKAPFVNKLAAIEALIEDLVITPGIGNFVWEDLDKDGIQDDDENVKGIANVKVELYNCEDPAVKVAETFTDAVGLYIFRIIHSPR